MQWGHDEFFEQRGSPKSLEEVVKSGGSILVSVPVKSTSLGNAEINEILPLHMYSV